MLNHRRFVAITILAAISLALPGYVLAQNYPPSVGQLAASTKKQVKTINMADFRTALDRNEVGVLVDIREPDEFADGRIGSAVNIPRGLTSSRSDRTSASQTIPTWAGN